MWIREEADVEKSPSGVSVNMVPSHSMSMRTINGCRGRNGEYILVCQSIKSPADESSEMTIC